MDPADREAIQFRSELTPTDMARVRVWLMWRQWSTRFLYIVVGGAVVFSAVAAMTVDVNSSSLPSLYIAGGFLVLLPVLQYVAGWLSFRRTPLERRSTDYSISREDIRVRTAVASSTLTWPAIHAANEARRYFFLWPQKRIVFPIPKRCFLSPEDVGRFRALLREKLQRKARVRKG